MRNGVLVCLGEKRIKNIGDYVQSLAAAQFAGQDPVLVERERLSEYAGGPLRLAMNGWFMFHPERFPPPPVIMPLLTSVHIRPDIEDRFFTPDAVAFLKAHEPIGCRSEDVVGMLARHGIRGEFSSCLTLTLGRTYRHREADAPPIFVDPWFLRPSRKMGWPTSVWWLASRLVLAMAHPLRTARLGRKFTVFVGWPGIRFGLMRLAYAAEFLRTYSTLFAMDVLLDADYATHAVIRPENGTDAFFLQTADALLRRYETAPFVVTSRLHCTLPCLGMETPVWTIVNPRMTTGRFGGNERFMNLIDCDGSRLVPRNSAGIPDGIVRRGDRPRVNEAYRPFAAALAARCRAFYGDGEVRNDG